MDVTKGMAERGDSEGRGEPRSRNVDRKRDARLVAGAAAAVLLVWFSLANLHDVTINFWLTDRQAPLIIVIVLAGLLGALLTALAKRRKPRGPTRGARE